MTALIKELPAEMRYFRIANDLGSVNELDDYAPTVLNIFQDLQHASFWYVFFYGRLHVLQTLLHFTSSLYKSAPEELSTRLLATVDAVCASVPFALDYDEGKGPKAFITAKSGGAVATHYLIWVLAAASSASGVPDAQRRWISDHLAHIGFVHGVKEALVYA